MIVYRTLALCRRKNNIDGYQRSAVNEDQSRVNDERLTLADQAWKRLRPTFPALLKEAKICILWLLWNRSLRAELWRIVGKQG
jgi:hypothetical protein